MSTVITTINATDLITNSRTDINNNFSSLNTNKIETSVLDTDNTLSANSDARIPSQKAVKTYVDTGGNVNASTTTKGIVEEATAAEVSSRSATGGTGARLYINPSTLTSLVKFGGTGTDGALSITSGTTTIDCANASVVIKNYTSISITGTGKLAFSNPNTNGTIIVLKSQGDVILTSSQTPMIDVTNMGAAAGTEGYGTTIIKTNFGLATAGAGVGGIGGAVASLSVANIVKNIISGKYPFLVPGAGGGGGGTNTGGGGGGGSAINAGQTAGNGANTGSSGQGSGSAGGGCLIIECGGAWNFTTTSGISVSGTIGGAATGGGNAGGGGGGGAGIFVGLYNTLTANTGTVTVTGGSGGAGLGSGTGGGKGGDGYSIVTTNTEFL